MRYFESTPTLAQGVFERVNKFGTRGLSDLFLKAKFNGFTDKELKLFVPKEEIQWV
jgi:hypothetical protein